jgi:ParB family chromosome partitioning protein
VVKAVDDQTLLTLALVENLQRANLNALEEAEGYQRLVDEFGLTQQQVADVVGRTARR